MAVEETLFSVIMPCYNRGSLIRPGIESLINQQYVNWELIVVDDGSTDNTAETVASFNDSRIQYLKTENRERGAARNSGIRMAKGHYVSFLDSDDFFLPNHLVEAFRMTIAHPSASVFHLNFELRDEKNNVTVPMTILPSFLNESLKLNNVVSPNGIFISSAVAKENLFSEIRDLSGTEDYELWLRLAAQFPVPNLNKVTSVLLVHEGRSMLEKDIEKTEKRIFNFLDLISKNNSVKAFLGAELNRFYAQRYSYISLHAALAGEKFKSLKYWKKASFRFPKFVFSKRSLIIFKRIFSK